jgi:hypothetical protein
MKLLILPLACALAAVPTNWTGTWELNVQKSTFGPILIPGAPEGFKVVSQKMTISESATSLKVVGETVFTDHAGSHSGHDEVGLPLDGTDTKLGPVTLSFKQIDESTFQILTRLEGFNEVSTFKFSADGKTLTETKTQTAPDKKTSTTVLRFSKSP